MIRKISEWTWKLIDKRKDILFFLIITAITIAIRILPMEYMSGDMNWCLIPWFDEIKQNGGLITLKNGVGDYNIPYMFILTLLTYLPFKHYISIKTVSIIFDYVLALCVMALVRVLLKDNPRKKLYSLLAYGIVLLLPSSILNSAFWGQCDCIYSAFAIISIIFLMKEKYVRAFIFLGISFAFKLQAVFLLPVFILVYLKRRNFSLLYLLIIPVVNLFLCAPAILAGRPLKDIMNIYVEQTSEYNSFITMNSVSIWNLFLEANEQYDATYTPAGDYVGKIAVLATISVFGIIAYLSLYIKKDYDKKGILSLTIWSLMICIFFLPYMHDRYGFMIDILSIVYFIVNRKKIWLPITINLISLCEYSNFLFAGCPIPMWVLSIIYSVVFALFSIDMYKEYFNINNACFENENKANDEIIAKLEAEVKQEDKQEIKQEVASEVEKSVETNVS